jgi:hypothetical protein
MNKNTLLLGGFIVLKFILHYALIGEAYNLHRDEYLYLDQAHHLDWGYVSVPPFTSWVSLLISFLGSGVFWVKFFPALFGALTMLVVWKTIEELEGNLLALVLGATGVLFSVLLRLNILYQPNSFDIFSWTLLYFVLIKYFKTEHMKWLFIGAIVFAIGFLNKYNIAFLVIGFIPALILTEQRKIFAQPKLYVALGLGLLIMAPNLIWQYKHNFPVIHHLNELAETQLVNVDRVMFLKSQILFFIGSFFVILASLYALLFYKPFASYKSFFWAIVFTLAVFLYFKAKDYYAIGLYPIYIAFGSVFLGHILKQGWKRYVMLMLILLPVAMFLPFYTIIFPIKTPEYIAEHSKRYKDLGLLRWEDGKDHELPQDFADMLGWNELAVKVDSVYNATPNKEKTLIICDNYGQAGAINYYTKLKVRAVSFNADYLNWFDLTEPYENLIRVKELKGSERELAETSPYFQSAFIGGRIENIYSREFGTTIFVFIDAKIDVRKPIQSEILENAY